MTVKMAAARLLVRLTLTRDAWRIPQSNAGRKTGRECMLALLSVGLTASKSELRTELRDLNSISTF
jgi:hypothetical protein